MMLLSVESTIINPGSEFNQLMYATQFIDKMDCNPNSVQN